MIRTHFGLRLSLGGGGAGTNGAAIQLDDLIAYYLGTVMSIDDATYYKSFLPTGNCDVAQVKGVSVKFDGTGYGTFTDPDTGASTSVVIPSSDWSEPISGTLITTSTSTYTVVCAGAVPSNNEVRIRLAGATAGIMEVLIYSGAVYQPKLVALTSINDGVPHTFSIDFKSGTASLSIDGVVESTVEWNLANTQGFRYVGTKQGGTGKAVFALYDFKGPGFSLDMADGTDDVHPTEEVSALAGGPNCTWSGFTGTTYKEYIDGSGSDRNILGWGLREATKERVTNGAFELGDVSWTHAAQAVIAGGALTVTADATWPIIAEQDISVLIGEKFIFTYEVSENTLTIVGGGALILAPSSLVGSTYYLSNTVGVHEYELLAVSTGNLKLMLTEYATSGTLVIDNISCKERFVTRQPAIQNSYAASAQSALRLGVFTDTHYSLTGSPGHNQEVNVPEMVNNFDTVGCDVILSIGDTYEGFYGWTSEADMERDVTTFEGWCDQSDIPKMFVVGNHDQYGAYDLFGFSKYARDHNSRDVGNYKIIYINNVSGEDWEADSTNLLYLEAELELSRIEGKKAVIFLHARIDQDWPGDPAVIFSGNQSTFSYNAAAQRAIINTAITLGTEVQCVLQGHAHMNTVTYDVDGMGVDYYTVTTAMSQPKGYVFDIDNGVVTITSDDVIARELLSLQYNGPIAASMKVVGMPCVFGDDFGYITTGVTCTDIEFLSGNYIHTASQSDNSAIIGSIVSTSNMFFVGVSATDKWLIGAGSQQAYIDYTFVVGELYKFEFRLVGLNMVFTVNDVILSSTPLVGSIDTNIEIFLCALNNNGSPAYTLVGKIFDLAVTGSRWPCEAGTGILLEDTIGGHDATLAGFATPWGVGWTRDVGECLMCKNGFSFNRVVAGELYTGQALELVNSGSATYSGTDINVTGIIDDASGVRARSSNVPAAFGIGGAYISATISGLTGTWCGFKVYSSTFSLLASHIITEDGPVNVSYAGSEYAYIYLVVNDGSAEFNDFSVKELLPGVSVANTDGFHLGGGIPTYLRNTWANAQNAPVKVTGALGRTTQAIAPWTGEAQLVIADLPFNTGGKTFECDNGLAYYSTSQSAENIAKIAAKLCSPTSA